MITDARLRELVIEASARPITTTSDLVSNMHMLLAAWREKTRQLQESRDEEGAGAFFGARFALEYDEDHDEIWDDDDGA